MIKEYSLYKTVKKTARENNLYVASYGYNVLADMSLLDDISQLEIEYREAIINNIQKYHIYHDRQSVFIVLYDAFITFEVRAQFANHSVYSTAGKKLYTIAQMTAVKITKIRYTDMWKTHRIITEYIKKTLYSEPLNDIEI